MFVMLCNGLWDKVIPTRLNFSPATTISPGSASKIFSLNDGFLRNTLLSRQRLLKLSELNNFRKGPWGRVPTIYRLCFTPQRGKKPRPLPQNSPRILIAPTQLTTPEPTSHIPLSPRSDGPGTDKRSRMSQFPYNLIRARSREPRYDYLHMLY